jgi:hypothetical protein
VLFSLERQYHFVLVGIGFLSRYCLTNAPRMARQSSNHAKHCGKDLTPCKFKGKKAYRGKESKPAGCGHCLAGEDLAVMGESFGSTAAFVQHFQGCQKSPKACGVKCSRAFARSGSIQDEGRVTWQVLHFVVGSFFDTETTRESAARQNCPCRGRRRSARLSPRPAWPSIWPLRSEAPFVWSRLASSWDAAEASSVSSCNTGSLRMTSSTSAAGVSSPVRHAALVPARAGSAIREHGRSGHGNRILFPHARCSNGMIQRDSHR